MNAQPALSVEPGTEVSRQPGTAMVQVRGVHKRWERRLPLFADVDLDFPRGAAVALTGANGAGKTTFLRVLAGLIDADGGTVTIEGLHPRRDRRAYARRVGYLSAASGGLYARLTVARHLDYWGHLTLLDPRTRAVAVDNALDSWELRDLATRRVDRISMGQRQRVRLALSFLHSPAVVMLDEPWNSLDDAGTRILNDRLAAFTQDGGVAIWCIPGTGPYEAPDAVYVVGDGRIERL